MKKLITILSVTGLALMTSGSQAHPGRGGHDSLHACLKAASAIKDGYYVKVEYLSVTTEGSPSYEIEIEDDNGVQWEFMCKISKGIIYEMEREVDSAADPLFKKRMKVDKKTASETALEIYPGRLVHTEYEIEADGSASYEFDIVDKRKVTYEVEVDAETGEITEANIEAWDIGREKGED
jgi:uncharacterized membrane protein YkoI